MLGPCLPLGGAVDASLELWQQFPPPLIRPSAAGVGCVCGGGGRGAAVFILFLSLSTPVNSPLIRDGGVNFGDNSPEKDNAQAA